ncbi:hypothetical protein DFQ27_000156 [Actinomortierella ambigua]|uniref:Protein kinase domain-containing protein n=1 Tax=Actinomortierella ambigua TaxID=1343610 RepID=A0A9P6U983_9FUNG|nr:hypothetical protein DFQ27_000156 [Actinomortierella ambigua]
MAEYTATNTLQRDQLPVPNGYEEVLLPDFYAEVNELCLAVMEVKKPKMAKADIEDDARKLPCMLKIALNMLIHANVQDQTVLGFLVRENICEVFSMNLAYEAIYIPKSLGRFLLPQNQLGIPGVLPALGPLAAAKHSLLALGESHDSGTFGAAHVARWGNQPCAAKAFFVNQSDFHQDVIQKEISLLQTLRHRHIIQFYRTHEEDNRVYLLVELAARGSLCRAIATGELGNNWPTKMRLAQEIAQGLAFIHQEKVLHRDLKSANVLLTKHMEVKLADFGLAKVRSLASAASIASQGTLRWVAPELLYASKPEYSTRSDVYALGVVMWEMAANCTRPFKDQENDALVALSVSNGSRETFPADTPAEYRECAERCWHRDPARRPAASEVVLIPEEQHEACAEMDATDSDLEPHLTSLNDNQDTEQHVDRLLPTDDDVATHLGLAAKNGSVDAQLSLGWIYEHGHGVDKSDKDAFWWYRLAASQGTAVAQLRVAKMYQQGLGVEASDENALLWYRRASEGGSAEAWYRLGDIYSEGRGVSQDDMEAVKWYRMAANQGHGDAQTTLGQWYSLGREVTQSDDEAIRWLTKAAVLGNASAQRILGLMYEQGRGVEQSDIMAVEWYTKAAEQGEADAQRYLGWMYGNGRGVEQNDVEVVKWYMKAAEQGNPVAQFNLALRYEEGRGVQKSDAEAIKWYRRAAERGEADAQCNLGLMFEQGCGVEQCDVEAVGLYMRAAECGHVTAQFNLSLMYDHGRGVEMDSLKAAEWYGKAAEGGHAAAQFSLGSKYEQGLGVDQSDVEAIKWYTKAARQGSAAAQFSLGWMYERGQGVDQSDVEALRWYMKAADQRHAFAEHNIGWLFNHGRGIDWANDDVVNWFTKLKNQGTVNYRSPPLVNSSE